MEKVRAHAKAKGEIYYLTGKACSHGHFAKRVTTSGKCTECKFPSAANHREYNSRWKAKYPGREQEVKYRHRYGLELSEIRPKPECCEVCGNDHPKIVLDHCHNSGAFRGWLCDPCNVVLGMVKDNPDVLERLAGHLRRPQIGNQLNLLKIQSNGLRKG